MYIRYVMKKMYKSCKSAPASDKKYSTSDFIVPYNSRRRSSESCSITTPSRCNVAGMSTSFFPVTRGVISTFTSACWISELIFPNTSGFTVLSSDENGREKVPEEGLLSAYKILDESNSEELTAPKDTRLPIVVEFVVVDVPADVEVIEFVAGDVSDVTFSLSFGIVELVVFVVSAVL